MGAIAAKDSKSIGTVRVSASGQHSFALYEQGENAEQEHKHHITEPGKMTRINAIDKAAFTIRSVDMSFRAKFYVQKNADAKTKATYPWELTFQNLMMEEENLFELKHSNSGYVWIQPGT